MQLFFPIALSIKVGRVSVLRPNRNSPVSMAVRVVVSQQAGRLAKLAIPTGRD
jgi:hypothetical protein